MHGQQKELYEVARSVYQDVFELQFQQEKGKKIEGSLILFHGLN